MKKCTKHPKYNGKKTPIYACMGCLNLYLNLRVFGRKLPSPSNKVHKSKKTYSRKDKHKSKDE